MITLMTREELEQSRIEKLPNAWDYDISELNYLLEIHQHDEDTLVFALMNDRLYEIGYLPTRLTDALQWVLA